MTTPSLDDQKEVAFYGAAVTAWFTTSLEHDKSLLTLSAGGIGLHLTLLTTVGLKSAEALALYIAAILCFSAALLAVLIVFRRNQRHIEDIVAKRITGTDPTLERLDLFAFISFGIGALLTALVGIGAAIHSFSEKEQNMSDKQKSAQSVPTFDSVNGAARLQPTVRIEKSFSGAAALQPAASQPTTPAPAAQANTPAAQAQAPSPPPANSK